MITADFKKTDIYENIKQQLNGLDIGILGTVCVTVQFDSAFRALFQVKEFFLHFVVFFVVVNVFALFKSVSKSSCDHLVQAVNTIY